MPLRADLSGSHPVRSGAVTPARSRSASSRTPSRRSLQRLNQAPDQWCRRPPAQADRRGSSGHYPGQRSRGPCRPCAPAPHLFRQTRHPLTEPSPALSHLTRPQAATCLQSEHCAACSAVPSCRWRKHGGMSPPRAGTGAATCRQDRIELESCRTQLPSGIRRYSPGCPGTSCISGSGRVPSACGGLYGMPSSRSCLITGCCHRCETRSAVMVSPRHSSSDTT